MNNDIKAYLSAIGKKGGNATKEKRGTEFYRKIGQKGKATRWGIKPDNSPKD